MTILFVSREFNRNLEQLKDSELTEENTQFLNEIAYKLFGRFERGEFIFNESY